MFDKCKECNNCGKGTGRWEGEIENWEEAGGKWQNELGSVVWLVANRDTQL